MTEILIAQKYGLFFGRFKATAAATQPAVYVNWLLSLILVVDHKIFLIEIRF